MFCLAIFCLRGEFRAMTNSCAFQCDVFQSCEQAPFIFLPLALVPGLGAKAQEVIKKSEYPPGFPGANSVVAPSVVQSAELAR